MQVGECRWKWESPASGEAMAELLWARVQGEVNCELRRGAWYRVAGLTPAEAILEVNRRHVPVSADVVKIVSRPPRAWAVVERPRDATRLPATWGHRYAVCPGCRNRAALKRALQNMRCLRCDRTFPVAWHDWISGTVDPGVTS